MKRSTGFWGVLWPAYLKTMDFEKARILDKIIQRCHLITNSMYPFMLGATQTQTLFVSEGGLP
jgi:hypothetical protein